MNRIDNSECLVAFGDFIKKGRQSRGLTQTFVAESLDMNQSYYSLIERGRRVVDLNTAIAICRVLQLDMREFVVRFM